jgi:hypothetical protein
MATGQLHVPDLSRIGELHSVEQQPERLSHLDSLIVGRPVVAEAFMHAVSTTRRFEVYPDKTIEESRSAHGVGFGRFVGWLPSVRKGPAEETSLLRVAIKPFGDPETALRELHGYRRLGGLGVETFQPVGIFPAQHGDHYLGMTLTRKDLKSLDRDLWVPGRRITSEATAEIASRNARTVDDIARLTAYLNAQGIFLPDGQIKNWAVNPEGTTGAIDTENITEMPLGSPDAPQEAWECIDKLVKSLILDTKDVDAKMFGVGMLAGMSLEQVRENVEELIIIPYIEELEKLEAATTNNEERQHIQALHEGLINNFYGDTSWPGHLTAAEHARYRREEKPALV